MQSARRVRSEEARSTCRCPQPSDVGRRAAAPAGGVGTGRCRVARVFHRAVRKHRRLDDPATTSQLAAERQRGRQSRPRTCSVSLGLIVTELVINAVKHAFPEGRGGEIAVELCRKARAGRWRWPTMASACRVCGAGKSGLGTSLIEALAKQLHAIVSVVDSAAGHHGFRRPRRGRSSAFRARQSDPAGSA